MNPPLEITCRQTQAQLAGADPPLLVDCREADEHVLVSIAGSRLLPMSEIATRVSELAGREDQPIIVHCHHGGRSAQVAMWLRGQGFAQAQSMAGGIDEWAVDIEPGMARY